MYVRELTVKDHKEFYTLVYKSFFERNDIGIDFDEVNFNNVVKNVLVNDSHYSIGLFENYILIGCAVIMLEKIPFSGESIAIFDLVHTDVSHRNLDCYQKLFDAIMSKVEINNIKRIACNAKNIMLDFNLKQMLLQRNDFYKSSVNWERNI